MSMLVKSHDALIALGHHPVSLSKAIRLRCLDCCVHQPSEVAKCAAVRCPLYPFRLSKNPWRKPRHTTARQLAALTRPREKSPSIDEENSQGEGT